MKERPILFNTDMVQAILAGRKTQTRRLVPEWQLPSKTEGPHDQFPDSRFISIAQRDPRYGFGVFGATEEACMANYKHDYHSCGPFGMKGDRLWVRETFRPWHENDLYCGCYDICTCPSEPATPACYLADGNYIEQEDRENYGIKWKPSIHMPRWACRIILEITSVRVERLQDITEADAKAEGFDLPAADGMSWKFNAKHNFKFQWDKIYKNWSANPWVWVVEFKVLTTNGKVPEVAA